MTDDDDGLEPAPFDPSGIPDWHCVHHGEAGNGVPACTGCAEYWGRLPSN